MSEISYIGGDELVYNSEGGINSGGFSVNSIMMKLGMSPIMTVNQQTGGGDKVSDLFESLVVPNWAFMYENKQTGGSYEEDDEDNDSSDDEISDDLHTKLLEVVTHHENTLRQRKKKVTRRTGGSNKKGTKRKKMKVYI